MKNFYYYAITLLTFVLVSSAARSQGSDCASAAALCSDNATTFPASTSTTAEAGPDYGCLLDQPNPAWYFLQIDQGGNLDIALTNSADIDIDFICWGPFPDHATACANLTGGGPFDPCTFMGTYPCGNIVDCSFDMATSEEVNISGAVGGEVYLLLITNFDGLPTDITAETLPSSTGNTDCSIVPPAGCYIDYMEANIGPCAPDNTYSLSGYFTFVDNPGAGTIVVEVDNGSGTYTQTFNPPFVDGQQYNYNISGIPADGAATTVTVYFTADPACTQEISYTGVADCSCAADIGTFTPSIPDEGTPDYVLCYGETLDIVPNGDFTPAAEAFNPPGPIYDPGVGWIVYSCPPTIGLDPAAAAEVDDDPCYVGIWGFADLAEINDQFWMDNYPGVFTDNIVYFMPLTFYSVNDYTYSYTNTSVNCFDYGALYSVQYLPEVTTNLVEDCGAGTVTVTLSGGAPAVDGSQFTAVAGSLTPAGASFANTSCGNGGSIVVQGLNAGDNYSFEITSGDGCTETFAGILDGSGGATITYPQTDYCIDEPNPTPNLAGPAGGTYTATPAGLTINPVTGTITLATSAPGDYTVNYTAPGGICPPNDDFDLTVHPLPVVNAGPDQTVCSGQQVTLSGSGAQTYTWDNGVTNGVPFTPVATQTYTVTGTSAAGCQGTDQVTVTVQTAPGPQFSANVTSGCAPLQVTFTNLSGGVGCAWDFGNGQTGVGCNQVTATFTSTGCFDITLATTDASGCIGTTTLDNYICVIPGADASFTPVPNILSSMDPTTQMVNSSTNATGYQWTFGDGSAPSNANNPIHTFPIDEPGSYVIQLIALSECPDTAWATVIVEEEVIFYVPNTFTPDNDEFNQTFKPVFTAGFDPFDFNMLIFNRWGEVVFESNNAEIGWDGTYHGLLVPDGTYTWKIDFKKSANDAHEIAVGHINVQK